MVDTIVLFMAVVNVGNLLFLFLAGNLYFNQVVFWRINQIVFWRSLG